MIGSRQARHNRTVLLRIQLPAFKTGAYVVNPGHLHHQPVRPLVYFDHWAMILFGADAELRARFANSLRRTGGTLCLSAIHAGELCRVDDARHAKDFDALLAEIMPQAFWIDTTMMLKERDKWTEYPPGDMHAAAEMMRSRREGLGFYESVWTYGRKVRSGKDTLTDIFNRTNTNTAQAVGLARQGDEFRRKAQTFQPKNGRAPAWVVLGELLRPTVLNDAQRFTVNDSADMVHALSLLHCDYVLLDGGWTARAEGARKRLLDAGISLGRVYSKRAGGVEHFLADLEAQTKVS